MGSFNSLEIIRTSFISDWFPPLEIRELTLLYQGKRQVNKLLAEWNKLDRATAPNTFIPNWRVSTPGIFRSTAVCVPLIGLLPAMKLWSLITYF